MLAGMNTEMGIGGATGSRTPNTPIDTFIVARSHTKGRSLRCVSSATFVEIQDVTSLGAEHRNISSVYLPV